MKKYHGKEHFPFSPEKNAQGELYCASATEMTGLIPANPPQNTERENYQQMFPYLPSDPDSSPA